MSNSRKRKANDDVIIESDLTTLATADETVSKYFVSASDQTQTKNDDRQTENQLSPPLSNHVVSQVLNSLKALNDNFKTMTFSRPVLYVYNPTEYAFDSFRNFLLKYGSVEKNVLILGMNPGPWGMSQTGVPFGEIDAVKNWLKITGSIGKPSPEDPARPVLGFECRRSEVSGKRFWGLAKVIADTPEKFFKNSFVHNYCPLQFIGPNSRNITPDQLNAAERDKLYEVCDKNLLDTIKIYNCKIIIGVGKFAENRFKKIAKYHDLKEIQIFSIPHPSPRVLGNQNWQEKTIKIMESLNLLQHFAS